MYFIDQIPIQCAFRGFVSEKSDADNGFDIFDEQHRKVREKKYRLE